MSKREKTGTIYGDVNNKSKQKRPLNEPEDSVEHVSSKKIKLSVKQIKDIQKLCSLEGCDRPADNKTREMKLCVVHRQERKRRQSALSSKKYIEGLKSKLEMLSEVVEGGEILQSLCGVKR